MRYLKKVIKIPLLLKILFRRILYVKKLGYTAIFESVEYMKMLSRDSNKEKFSEIYSKNLIYKGYTVQPYSPAAGSGLSSHELNQPGAYKEISDTSIVAQFKCKKDGLSNELINLYPFYFLAWTTTPWTLPSNTALTVGKKINYSFIGLFPRKFLI